MMKPKPILMLAGYVFWLHAVPMEGLLRQDCTGKGCLLFFLLPHALALLALARFTGLIHRPRLIDLSVLAVFTLTAFYPSFSNVEHLALAIMGVFAAPLLLRICLLLRDGEHPLFGAALGVCFGQMALLLIPILAGHVPVQGLFFLVGMPVLFFRGRIITDDSQEVPSHHTYQQWFSRLALIFLFFMLQGLFFGNVISTYGTMRIIQDWGIVPYILAVILGAILARRHLDQTYGAAVGLAILALGLWSLQDLFSISPTFLIMIAASGFADMFVLAVMLLPNGNERTMGLASGAMCLGIAVGKAGEMVLGGLSDAVLILAHVMVSAAILCVYLLPVFLRGGVVPHSVKYGFGAHGEMEDGTAVEYDTPQEENDLTPIPADGFGLLSDQERKVLDLFAQGLTSRESADKLGLAQSTVKTYIRRIYSKTRVKGKQALKERIALHAIAAKPSKGLSSKDKNDESA